jgi:Flp pilus assembly protein TadD
MNSWHSVIAFGVGAALVVALGGCGGARRSQTAYRTIAEDLGRDTDRAKLDNARAVELIEARQWPGAEKSLKSALTADVTFGPAHNNLGKVYFHTGRYYLAAWEFKYATKLMPFQPEPKNNLAMVLEAVGKLDDAVERYDEALAMEPENPELVGNAARARVRRGDSDARVRELLSQLILHDTRPDWVEWARERLATDQPQLPSGSTTSP